MRIIYFFMFFVNKHNNNILNFLFENIICILYNKRVVSARIYLHAIIMNSITEIWEQLSYKYSSRIALKDEATGYSISFTELHQNINKIIKILKNCNILAEEKVVLFFRPHPLWHVIDQAIMKSNNISVPCEFSSNFEEVFYILKITKSKCIFTSNFKFIETFCATNFSLKEKVIIFYIGTEDISCFKKDTIEIYNLIELLKNTDISSQDNFSINNPDDIATIVFSSGTTGEPKGAVITHRSLFLAFSDHKKVYGNVSGKKCINIHCCSHIAPRIIELVFLFGGNTIIYTNYINFLKTVRQYKAEYLLCVPKLLNIISDQYKREVAQKNKSFQKLHNLFFYMFFLYFKQKDDNKHTIRNIIVKLFFHIFYHIYSKNFCNNILNNFINKQTTILVFGNLVVKNLELFFKVIDIDLLIIYGATEVVTYISYSSTKYDITNKLNPQLNVEIKDLTTNNKLNFNQTGLIKIRGKQLMKEYYDDEQKTKEVFDNEGYYTIGDLGYISNDGCLYFEGREKNIIVLNNGEKINPVKIEDICKESLFIDQIIVVGQEKPYLTALVVLNKEYVDKWIKKQKVNIYNDYIDSLKKEILIEINNLIGENKFFKWIEQVKNISFIEEPFTVENGMLTKKYTMARNKIYANYREIIENMYK